MLSITLRFQPVVMATGVYRQSGRFSRFENVDAFAGEWSCAVHIGVASNTGNQATASFSRR